MTMRAAPPERSSRLLRRGGIVRVYRATLDGVRDCQAEGRVADIEAMDRIAGWALLELERVRLSHWARQLRWLYAR